MVSSTSNTANATSSPPTYGSDSTSLNTTFVQADPSTFRSIVQKLTGAPDVPSTQKLPITHPTRPAAGAGPTRPAFKLQDRRPSAKNLQINLFNNNNNNIIDNNNFLHNPNFNNCTMDHHHPHHHHHHDMFHLGKRGFLVSPVSPLDLFGRVSPRSPCEELCARGSPTEVALAEEEEAEEARAIAEKGFYLHPSVLSTPRGAEPPELLPLFPS